ncbi:MAG: outer-membrane lipoprotein carrier protein LolA [Pseudolabrys sp.]
MAALHKARTGQNMAMIALFAGLIAAPALAQVPNQVPLPTPRPAATTGSILPRPGSAAVPNSGQTQNGLGARAQAAPSAGQPGPVSNPFAALLGKAGSAAGGLNPEQKAIVDKVNNYLSGMQVLSGKFVQVGPDGRRSQGDFYISKPGKVRFEYDEPSPIELVADGSSVVVRDRRLATQDVFPLSQTPLRFLLSDKVDLMKDSHLTAVYADDVFITVVVEERNGVVGTSRLMIMFGAKDMALKQWTVTDPQGYDTTVAVYNLDNSRRPDPNMFRIDFTKYRN